MSIDALIMLAGGLVAILPFLGFPSSWDNVLFFLLGAFVIALGIIVRRHLSTRNGATPHMPPKKPTMFAESLPPTPQMPIAREEKPEQKIEQKPEPKPEQKLEQKMESNPEPKHEMKNETPKPKIDVAKKHEQKIEASKVEVQKEITKPEAPQSFDIVTPAPAPKAPRRSRKSAVAMQDVRHEAVTK